MTDAKAILVTGGAGYIGAHACKALAAAGYVPIVFDNLSTGHAEAVRYGPLEEGDLMDRPRLDQVFAHYRPAAVMHFAALSLVSESVANPGRYWRDNIQGALNLIEAAIAGDCRQIVFSSSCAVYGDADGILLDEATRPRPDNPYGATKRAIEQMLADFGFSDGVRSVIFRYFNVAGADPDGEIGELHEPETHLIPLVLQVAMGMRPALTIFGADYPTADGTCIRDYVHVCDLIDAHLLGLQRLERGAGSDIFCLGSGRGFSVRQVIDQACQTTGKAIPVEAGARRSGDAVSLVCGSTKAQRELGWRPARGDLETIMTDAWRWHRRA